jgi:spore coat protein U-like protein
LCQKAVPYQLYKGLAFTTIWLEGKSSQKKMLGALPSAGPFLILL